MAAERHRPRAIFNTALLFLTFRRHLTSMNRKEYRISSQISLRDEQRSMARSDHTGHSMTIRDVLAAAEAARRMRQEVEKAAKLAAEYRPLIESAKLAEGYQVPVAEMAKLAEEGPGPLAAMAQLADEYRSPFAELAKLAEEYRSPLAEAAKLAEEYRQPFAELEKFAAEYRSPFSEIQKFATEYRSPFAEAAKLLSSLASAGDVTRVADPMLTIAQQVREYVEGFSSFQHSDTFRSLVEEARRSGSFVERVAANIAFTTADSGDESGPIDLEAAVADRVAALPPTLISREFVLNLLVSLVLLLYQEWRNAIGHEQVMQRLDEIGTAIERVAEQANRRLSDQADEATRFVVILRRLDVRVAPSDDAERIGVLRPGDRAAMRSSADDWLEIEYLDIRSGTLTRGWVVERHTKEVSPNALKP
jgi:DNA-directed RNA polymerase subunit F